MTELILSATLLLCIGFAIGWLTFALLNNAMAEVELDDGAAHSSQDTELLDWLDRRGHVNFSYNFAEIGVEVPDHFGGSDSVREILAAARALEEENFQ